MPISISNRGALLGGKVVLPASKKRASPAPAPTTTQEQESVVTTKAETEFSVDEELSADKLARNYETYPVDLAEAMTRLSALVEREGVSVAELRTQFVRVNNILLANPALATEIMLPPHLGELAKAAYKLSDVSIEAGSAAATKRRTSKQAAETKEKKATALVKAQLNATLADLDSEF